MFNEDDKFIQYYIMKGLDNQYLREFQV